MSRYKSVGWRNESQRHSLSAQGIANAITNNLPVPIKEPKTRFEGETGLQEDIAPSPPPEITKTSDTLTERSDTLTDDEASAGEEARAIAKGVGEKAVQGVGFLGSAFSEGLRSIFGDDEAQVQQQIMQDMDSVVLDEDGEPITSMDGTPKTKRQVEVERELEELEKAQEGGLFISDYRTEATDKRETIVDKIKDFLDFGKLESARENIFILKGQEQSYNDKISVLQTIRADVLSKSNRNAIPISDQFRQINQINASIGEIESDKRRLQDDIAHLQPKFNEKASNVKGELVGEPSLFAKMFDPDVPL